MTKRPNALYIHQLGEVDPGQVTLGMTVEPVRAEDRVGALPDISHFRPAQAGRTHRAFLSLPASGSLTPERFRADFVAPIRCGSHSPQFDSGPVPESE